MHARRWRAALWIRSNRRLQCPRLQPRHLENLGRTEVFLVNDPAAEELRRVLRHEAHGPQLKAAPERHAFARGPAMVLPLKLERVRERHEKTLRRNRLRTDEHP